MDHRRSRSIESPRRQRRDYRRYSRSRSRSPRERIGRDLNSRRRNSRSRSREHMPGGHYRRGGSAEKDLYRDLIFDDYQEDKSHRQNRGRGGEEDFNEDRERFWNERAREKGRDYEREMRDRDYDRGDSRHSRHGGGNSNSNINNNSNNNSNRRHNPDRDRDSDDSDEAYSSNYYYNKTPSNTIIVLGLQSHITEADIMSALIQLHMAPTSIRLIRKRNTGASRGFAFVEFNTIDEAAHWMELTQGTLVLQDQTRSSLQYSHSRELPSKSKINVTDWYCGKCGVFNFKRRDSCFKCYASREESEKGGEGSDEVSNILTKKIMLRNLDALTNEEGVLTAMQHHVPDLVKKISKILISRDTLTHTSRGICYLNFESLIDSMNLHNAVNALNPPIQIDNRDIIVTYCIDHENRQIVPKKISITESAAAAAAAVSAGNLHTAASTAVASGAAASNMSPSVAGQYTLADVPRLAEYSAAIYASTPAEHAQYLQYYTECYISEITKGHFGNLPTATQISEGSANSGAAVALSAIQRKQKKMNSIETTATQAAAAAAAAAAAVKAAIAAQTVVTPKGNDGKTYPTPDVSLYQYDDTSGYYYDPTTGLYYDAHSQYYYNSETGAYLYWDQHKSSYILATPAAVATVSDVKQETSEDTKSGAAAVTEDEPKKEKKADGTYKHDKVKVAKKIVKDMEKWAKQLNQKKDYTAVATPQPILPSKGDEAMSARVQPSGATGYADVGFSILEKKERAKLTDYMPSGSNNTSKLVSAYASDSDDEHAGGPPSTNARSAGGSSTASTATAIASAAAATTAASTGCSEKDYVDFQKLTCLLCKRAFQSLDILQKHLKMSNLHKENLQKYNMARGASDSDESSLALSYRDRAKERRLKYGEGDPPPPNRSRERFENEIKSMAARKVDAPPMPIGSNNVGNRLLQKMGWSEGQGLGRKNQGRTNIIEAETRTSTAGLGSKSGISHGDDYKTYIKKMMKSRYESA